ncbi:MAG: hypothetical protein AAF184_01850 [Pseudomonadota bacterium]
MAGDLPEVPSEAKTFNELTAWAAKHGQSESLQTLVSAAKAKDWDTALDAVHRLEDYADLAQKTEALGKHFDTIDKLGKAVEIAQAVERGDLEYAGAKLGAEVVDGVASGYLDSLGPGGVMLNYAVHETGEALSEKLTEYQQFGPDGQLREASATEGAMGAYQSTKDFLDVGMRERIDAGQSPAQAQQWAREYMESHAGVWQNLGDLEGAGPSFTERFEQDLQWVEERSEALAGGDEVALEVTVAEPGVLAMVESARPVAEAAVLTDMEVETEILHADPGDAYVASGVERLSAEREGAGSSMLDGALDGVDVYEFAAPDAPSISEHLEPEPAEDDTIYD